jgi:pimeloyl-ACP methyl ester carboxylesterase
MNNNNFKATQNGINDRISGDGPPVILVHGMAASLEGWELLRPDLETAGYQVLALDLPGHGDSIKPKRRSGYHIEEIYKEFVNWIDSLELKQPATIIGHSMGGYLSTVFALRQPDAVRSLVLADPFISQKQLFPLMRLTVRQPGLSASVLRVTPRWAVKSFLTWIKNHSLDLPPTYFRQMLIDVKRASPQILYTAPTVKDLNGEFSKVTAPTLVVWGRNDLTLLPASFPRVVSSLPNATSYEFRNCGHIPHLTHHNTFNELVLDFLNSLPETDARQIQKPT